MLQVFLAASADEQITGIRSSVLLLLQLQQQQLFLLLWFSHSARSLPQP